jgi:bifunctional UDP-N-acetylglucosamine pyrophosphorylase / glucosamine-1-phosphate N-acetyltransferase
MLDIVILAAGKGTRMRSNLPKVLQRVAGRPMLERVLDAAEALKPDAIHAVIGFGAEQVRARFAERHVHWVEQPTLDGTGGAVRCALPGLSDVEGARTLILYGDVPLLRTETLRALLEQKFAVLTATLGDPTGYGRIVSDRAGFVRAVVEQRDADAEQRAIQRINSGIVLAPTAALKRWVRHLNRNNAQGEYYLTDIFAIAADEGQPARFVDIDDVREIEGANDPVQLLALSDALYAREARGLLDQGVRLAASNAVFVRGAVDAGRDVEVDVQVIFSGRVTLGDGVRIGAFSTVKDCELAAGTEVLAHCDLDGVRTTGPCRIGPYARLRPGTELAEGSHVGNFVETKKTILGANSKANHLSYLGDARIGANVNIGAGTITCNYDGVNKAETTIGDGVFVGSNSSLVAPLVVGADATIGAGSVISKDAPAGELTIARARQVTVKGWLRPRRS